MKIVVIGSVAAGTSVAAKARRNDETAEIVVYEEAEDISYSVCGMPYFLGGEVDELDTLIPRDAEWFKKRFEIDIHTNHHVKAIHPLAKEIEVYDKVKGEGTRETYDKLVLATGSYSLTPPPFTLDTYENVFHVKTMDNTKAIDTYMKSNEVEHATIIGSGYIGLEMAEQLTKKGLKVSIVELADQIFPRIDADMAYHLEKELQNNNVDLHINDKVKTIKGEGKVEAVGTENGAAIETDLVILAVGVRPNTVLATEAEIELGETGAVKVDNYMKTSAEDVYAVGDVAETFHRVTGQPIYHPLGSTANKMGRIVGDHLTGGPLEFKGTLGTGIFRLFDLTVAFTGFSEKEAAAAGFDPVVVHNIKPAHAKYVGGKELTIKGVADRETGRFLGAQIVGPEGVDKRIDVFATAITFKATAEDLFHLDLAYAPPYSTTKDPVMYTGMVLENARKNLPVVTPKELVRLQDKDVPLQIIDVRSPKQYEKNHVKNAVNIPMLDLRKGVADLDHSVKTVVYCNKGVTSNTAQNLLLNIGFLDANVLSGGNTNYQNYIKSQNR
ncbi:NADPH-dependent 2,4-dienoyl-CoA reductase, sulfur reductase [Alkalibacterium putridalgicola]|uniref:NADH oxidase n=1 Tax=Alkalibacterium putridalgicola TaxID=426703 RepID=A0A1H7X203_9LACT|nr:FAD-dependent oxidoreductase [Alkalibacterium putridalgicola]GEK90195.1 NADH oxidase [Alkalibacterium putridalgicola]SEM27118.1 NADPH-dependent 2,4-dienoyl-CoA reductase, sulfur reductase [Alkalibacterium putridalgicola]